MGWNTWESIGKPLPNRLNIVLSRTKTIENQPNVLLVRSREQALALEKYLNCDLCVIGGRSVYELFADDIEKWIVTEIPETVADADTFMPADFLENFRLSETTALEDGLNVKIYQRTL